MKITKRILSIFLVVQFCFLATASLIFAEQSSINIGTVEEFCDFAKKCTLDSYSQGLDVKLTSSIDLKDSDFDTIPYFAGTFDGGGFTISGISIEKDGSYLGLFRHISKDGVVRALTVEGDIKATGSGEYIGGIVGENFGSIENCYFKGNIRGISFVGGIAGSNNGTISGSRSSGSVVGESQVGGIVGVNDGKVVSCENYCLVNTEQVSSQKSGFDLSTITSIISSITGISSLEDIANINLDNYAQINDIGGICGFNSGTIDSCSNNYAVGYTDQAYNVGGIAGRSSGFVNSCLNYATVLGRKDVGGIVGQLVPYADWDISVDKLDELIGKIDSLASSFNKITGSMSSVNNVSGDIEKIKTDISNLQKSISEIADGVGSDATTIIDSASKIITLISNLANDIKEANEDFDISQAIDNKVVAISEILASYIEEQSTINEGVKAQLKTILDDLMSSVRDGDYTAAQNDAKEFCNIIANNIQDTELLLKYSGELLTALLSFDSGVDFDSYIERFTSIVKGVNVTIPDFSDVTKHITSLREDTSSLIAKIGQVASGVANGISYFSGDVDTLFATIVGDTTELISGSLEGSVDLSVSRAYTGTNGAISDSKNFGDVLSQTNVGGIVGSSSIELSFDSEDVIDISSYLRSGAKYLTYACVRSCQSSGKISASKNNAGGIAGNMDFGYICDCTALGEISADESFVGGVAGKSASVISNCIVRSTIVAKNSVGGVTGKGCDINGCYVFTKNECSGEKSGSIAGTLDGTASSNYYVDFGLGGIDGVSYSGVAEGVSYEEMLKLTGWEDNNVFDSITVTFIKDGEVYAEYEVEFGGSIDTIPNVPMDGNRYWVWDDFDNTHIYYSVTVQGSYHDPISSISTSEEIPLFLAEGDFYDGMEIVATKISPNFDGASFNKDYVIDAYKVEITNFDGKFVCHWHQESGQDLYVLNSQDKWQKLDYKEDGSYIVFDLESGQSICYVTRIHFHLPIWAIILISVGGLAIVGTITFIVIKKIKKSKALQDDEYEYEDNTDEEVE